MAGGKETPRQKMIGMMYLVLTALLAMNVSKEVVDAFVTIDQGQRKTLKAVDSKLGTQLAALATSAGENPAKYGPANDAANSIHEKATALIDHINLIKAKTFAISIGSPIEAEIPAEVFSNGEFLIGLDSVKALVGIDNYDNNTNLMIGDDAANPSIEDNPDGRNYRAAILRDKLVAYRDEIISELQKIDNTETLVRNVETTFNFPSMEEAKEKGDQSSEGWVIKNFYHVPLAASTAMLTTLQSQIRSVESDLVDKLYTDVEGSSFKFNRLKGAVIPLATTIPQGSQFQADVFLAAYDDQNTPQIYLGAPGAKWDSINEKMIGETQEVRMEGTLGKVEILAGSLGVSKREGYINFKPVGGDPVKQPFVLEYNVVAPQLVVSADKMNVFYKGIPNPVTVSVPGFTDKDVAASMSGGSLKNNGGGSYTVNVSSGSEASIAATVTMPDGSKKTMAPVKFRLKRIPDPVPTFGQKGPSDNIIDKAIAASAPGVRADMGDFIMDVPGITVTSFVVVAVVGGNLQEIPCSGNKLNAQAKNLIGSLKKGSKFSIEQIKVNMPDGKRQVPSINLRIK